jgi:hypothetical protein
MKNITILTGDRMVWKGVIIEESLFDKSILNIVKIVKTRKTTLEKESERGTLTFLYFELNDKKEDEFVDKALLVIKDRFYLHICRNERMVVVYKNKEFDFSSNELNKLNQARDYGLSVGILREQMPFEELIKNPYG